MKKLFFLMLATVMFSVAAMAQSGKACCSKKGDASACSKKDGAAAACCSKKGADASSCSKSSAMMGKNVLNADSGSKQYCSSTAAENLQKKGFVTTVDGEGMITAKKVDAGTGDITTVSACPHSGKVITTQTCGKTGKVMSTETTEFSALQNGEEVVKEAKSQDASVLPAGPACNGGAKKGCCKKDGAKKD